MNIPRAKTIAARVVNYLNIHGPCTQSALVDYLSIQSHRDKAVKTIRALRMDGVIDAPEGDRVMATDVLSLSDEMRALLDESAEINGKPVYHGAIVPSPTRNVFGPAISAKNIPSAKGMREGSNDHLSWSSKHV